MENKERTFERRDSTQKSMKENSFYNKRVGRNEEGLKISYEDCSNGKSIDEALISAERKVEGTRKSAADRQSE